MLLRHIFAVLLMGFAVFSVSAAEQVNINSADIQLLADLKGVGPHKAEAIIAYREQYGAFRSVEDLAKVKGIGKRTIDINRARITISAGN